MKYLIGVLLVAGLFVMLNCSSENQQEVQGDASTPQEQSINITSDMLTTSKDLVCGMDLTNHTIADTAIYNGQLFGFCSADCKDKFKMDPEAALAKLEK